MPMVEDRVREALRAQPPLDVYRRLIADNDALIRGPDLANGRAIVAERSAVHTTLVAHWAAEQQSALGYGRPFAVAALGGTGRGEVTPCSDLDFALLFDDAIENNQFLLELQQQVLHSDAFRLRYGFEFEPLPFCFEDVPRLEGKQLNAFLDLHAVYDPNDLVAQFRDRIRATFDPFEHFLHAQSFWRDRGEKAAGESERLDRFDIKNDGLRVFLAGIWTLAGKSFVHSHDVYATLDDPRDLEAYDFLLRIRAFVHRRRDTHSRPTMTGDHAEDILGFEDFTAFGELLGPGAETRARFEFANDVRARLLSARRRVARFTSGVIGRELRAGREHRPGSPIRFGVGGLRHVAPKSGWTAHEKSRAALSLLLASQRYGVPIDRTELEGTFRNAADWMMPVPELSSLFYERRGSLADTSEFLARLGGVSDRLFPGYGQFEVSLDERVLRERKLMRGALEREKLRALEQFVRDGEGELSRAVTGVKAASTSPGVSVAVEAALLDGDHLAAVKLALKTKRLPLTADDLALRRDEARSLHERFSTGFSDIPLDEYYPRCMAGAEFTPDTLRVARFLVANRRAFKDRSNTPNDARQVAEFVALCENSMQLRALFVFTCADRVSWETEAEDPARWFNSRELYVKAQAAFSPAFDPTRSLSTSGYSADELAILRDFGEDFFSGFYRHHANRFGAHLVRLAQDPAFQAPKVIVLREGASTILGIAARDYRGLAACISGALRHHGIALRQAHLFSAMNHQLALDFFHLAPRGRAVGNDLARALEDAIQRRLFLGTEELAGLSGVAQQVTLSEWRSKLYCLRGETSGDVGVLIYALTCAVFRHLEGNVFGLNAHTGQGGAWVTVYHSLPPGRSLDDARAILREHV